MVGSSEEIMGKTYHYDEDEPRRDKEALKRARQQRANTRRIPQDSKPKKDRKNFKEEDEKELTW